MFPGTEAICLPSADILYSPVSEIFIATPLNLKLLFLKIPKLTMFDKWFPFLK